MKESYQIGTVLIILFRGDKMKYRVIAKSPFYCLKLNRSFTKGSIVEIKDTVRAGELVDAGLLAVVAETKKKSTRKKKVKTDE